MKRLIIDKLREWKGSNNRKPLILRGARQVGKTWILEKFGEEFEDGFLRINFDKDLEIHQFFENTKNVERILNNISLAFGKKITKNTLIIFDEIQACPNALNSLKYFCEDAKEYYVVAAGSLLGVKLANGFPVGKVNFLDMGPMSFKEFLYALGDDNFVEYMDGINCLEQIPDVFSNQLIEKLKSYLMIGGMPEAVKTWVEERDIKKVENVISDILDGCENDFGKHAPKVDINKINMIWKSIPSQLAKENKKFQYSVVKESARAREYEDALLWIINAGVFEKISKITKPGLPISAYEDLQSFKIYFDDVGLLRKHSRLSYTAYAEGDRLFTEFKGSLTENFVIQSLIRQYEICKYYWQNGIYEVDFIIQKDNDIIPIEVKSGNSISSPSLKQYLSKYIDNTKIAVRYSLKNLSFDGKILNIPLYLIDQTDKLINLALNR